MDEREHTTDLPRGEYPVDDAGRETARLAETLRRREQQLARLIQITEHINYGVSLDDVLNFVFEQLHEVIPYHRIGFSLIDEPRGVVVARWGRSDRAMSLGAGYEAKLEGSSLEQIIETGKPRIINDLDAYLRSKPQSTSTRLIVEEGMRSSLTCPLIVLGRPVGFLFFSSVEKETYSLVHVDFFRQIAGLLSAIVEKGRLYSELADQKAVIEEQNRTLTEELEMARGVQRALIPTETPVVSGLEIACDYEPALQIGGDLLDVIPLAHDRTLLMVGDAMGHGVQAALVMAVTKTALQGAVQTNPDPAQVLSNINQMICRLCADQFVTAACCVLNLGTLQASLALAGHPWPCWVNRDGTIIASQGTVSLPLGVDRGASYEAIQLPLSPDDLLVFYTDGVVDAFDPDHNRYGVERLAQQVTEHRNLTLPSILNAIRNDLARHCKGHPMVDDVAMLAVRKRGN